MSKVLPTLGEVCVDYCTDDHPGMHPRVEVDGKLVASVGNMEQWADAVDQWRANADLIGAAFTAAHRIETELGFDPIKVFEMLPGWLSRQLEESDRREIERQMRAAGGEVSDNG